MLGNSDTGLGHGRILWEDLRNEELDSRDGMKGASEEH